MRKLCRTAILFAIALLSIPPAALFVPGAFAAALPSGGPQAKKKSKNKNKRKDRKQKILKGRHSQHSRRPA